MKNVVKSASGKQLKHWEATVTHGETKAEIQREIKRRKRKKI